MKIDQLKNGSRMKMPVGGSLNPFYGTMVVSARTDIVESPTA